MFGTLVPLSRGLWDGVKIVVGIEGRAQCPWPILRSE